MRLGELRKVLRDDPNARNCHICAWTATPRRATLVMSGANGQWYDCGEHPDEPNGKPLFSEDINEWMLKHGLVEGKKEPERPGPAPTIAEQLKKFAIDMFAIDIDWATPLGATTKALDALAEAPATMVIDSIASKPPRPWPDPPPKDDDDEDRFNDDW